MNKLTELFAEAHRLQQEDQFNEAIKVYEQVLQIEPQHQEGLHFLGLTYAQIGNIEQALDYLIKANEIKPEAHLLNNLANAYKKAIVEVAEGDIIDYYSNL